MDKLNTKLNTKSNKKKKDKVNDFLAFIFFMIAFLVVIYIFSIIFGGKQYNMNGGYDSDIINDTISETINNARSIDSINSLKPFKLNINYPNFKIRK